MRLICWKILEAKLCFIATCAARGISFFSLWKSETKGRMWSSSVVYLFVQLVAFLCLFQNHLVAIE